MREPHVKTAVRKLARDNRLGDGPKVCVRCGYSDPVSLIPVTEKWLDQHKVVVPRSLFQRDHVVGRNHDREFTVPICRNCHGEVTELRRLSGISMRFEPDQCKREILRLEGLALFHESTALALRRWAAEKRMRGNSNE